MINLITAAQEFCYFCSLYRMVFTQENHTVKKKVRKVGGGERISMFKALIQTEKREQTQYQSFPYSNGKLLC